MSELKPWERQPSETAKAYAAFLLYRDLPPVDRSIVAAVAQHRYLGGKASVRNWETWSSLYNWSERGLANDSDLASRRRERMAKEMERAQDDMFTLARAALAKVAERIKGMNPEDLAAGQVPAALRTLFELELKALGYEDRVELTGKDGGPVKVDTKTQHVFQPDKELWDKMLRKRAEYERLRDGDTDGDTTSDSL